MFRYAITSFALGWAAIACCADLHPQTTQEITNFPKLSASTDWPWWRGPLRNGIAHPSSAPPTKWSDTENVVWKTPVPGRGHASPTIIGNRIFLSTADEKKEIQSVVAFDRVSGKQLWQTEISRGGLPKLHNHNTHASPTVAGDGDLLFVTFHHHDQLQAVALDHDGKIVWDKSLGEFRPKRYEYGYGASPVIYRDTVIVAAEYDGDSFITALNRKNGEQVWRTPRPNNITFSSPSIVVIGKQELLAISGSNEVACYDPVSGKRLWGVAATTAATCGTIVWEGDILFASGGYPKSETVAIRVADRGEVLWKNMQNCYEDSMLVSEGYLYAFTGKGVMYCFQASDGKQMWQQRLRGSVSASPVLAGGHIYWANERGTTYVFKANPQAFELVAENVLGDESFASPAVSGNHLFLRVAAQEGNKRQEYLYCIGK